MKKLLALTAAATALFATQASAAAGLDERTLILDANSAMIEDITEQSPVVQTPGYLPLPPAAPQVGQDGRPIGEIIGAIDAIVNLADKIFDLIAKNQPVVTINVKYANAVPYGYSHWTQMQGWSKPATKKYEFTIKNSLGGNAVSVVYQLHWTHSGNYQGKGKFLTGVTIEPLSVTTAWGHNVDLTAEVPDSTIANVGTSTDPVAAMQVQLKWKVHTIVSDLQEKAIYYIQGDGTMEPIGAAFTRALEQKNQKKLDAMTERLAEVRFN